MIEQIHYPFPSPLDIRASFALAKIHVRFDLAENERMMEDALRAAFDHAVRAGDCADGETAPACPLLFADEPVLEAAWQSGMAEQVQKCLYSAEAARVKVEQAASVRQGFDTLQSYPFPTAAEMWAQLQGGSVTVRDTALNLDEDGIWITNGFGQDALIQNPDQAACQRIIDVLRAGGQFGLTPEQGR